MKVMLVTARGARTRRFDLREPAQALRFTGLIGPFMLGLLAVSFAFGMLAQARWFNSTQHQLHLSLSEAHEQLDDLRELRAGEHEAFSRHLGELQARMLRLDALGSRLVQQAALDPAEFDFAHNPSQGGPAIEWLEPPEESTGLQDQLTGALRDAGEQELQLSALSDLLQSRAVVEAATPEGMPVARGWISSFFGRRNDPFTGRRAHHRGIDFAGREGSPIVAVASGVVVYSGPRYGYGNLVEINHGAGLVTRYGHNQKNLVAVGATVERGEQIALMGQTGRATGPHLHFEVHRDGRAVDPLAFINAKKDPTTSTPGQ
ncbi:MAG: M23 family metallopeptidase [Pseudomonadota bacterium]